MSHDRPAAVAAQHTGMLAEFEELMPFMEAAAAVRDAGYTRWDTHTPFPMHGLNDAMGLKATRLPWVTLVGGVLGCGLALWFQWWTNAVDYPFLIGGKPLFSLPANIPIIFEGTVLLAALGTFFGMLVMNGLPQWHHPVFTSERFRRATSDRFFISIAGDDARFDAQTTRQLLESLGALAVEDLAEEPAEDPAEERP